MSFYFVTTVRDLEKARCRRDYIAEKLDRLPWWRVVKVCQGIYALIQAEKLVWELERRMNRLL